MSLKYRPEIDGLRAVSVLAVVFFHADFAFQGVSLFRGGYIGVDIFFVISGYLISSIILREIQDGTFRFSLFYERRARRILPALFVVMSVSVPFAWAYLIPDRMIAFGKSMISALFFLANHYFLSGAGYFDVGSMEKPFLHTWTLSIEEQFYVVFPIIILLAWKFARNYLIFLFIFGFLFSLRYAHFGSYTHPDTVFYLLPARGWELLAGAILAKLELDKGRISHPFFDAAMPALGISLIVYAFLFFDDGTPHPSLWTLIPVTGAMMVIWFSGRGEIVGNVLGSKPFVAIGLISYSLYLWHFPVFSFAIIRAGITSQFEKAGYVALSIVLASATYFLVEKPFRNRNLMALRPVSLVLAAFFSWLVIFSIAAIQTKGFGFRYGPEDKLFVEYDREKYANYVKHRFNELSLAKFEPADNRIRLLVIGDSYGQDLVNMLSENSIIDEIQISTFYIPARCGNLFLDFDFSNKIDERHREGCANIRRRNNQTLLTRMREADIVWLASSWKLWQAELLPKSLENIKTLTDAKILILGRKNFGVINLNKLMKVPVERRQLLRNTVASWHLETNRVMKDSLPPENFIDLHQIVCGDDNTCPLFVDDQLSLISYDGGHLTKSGARYVGERLLKHPVVSDAFRELRMRKSK